MRAARFVSVGRPLELQEIPVPEPRPGEVLVRVAACGVCASDVHLLDGSLPSRAALPVTMGHEASGTVEALGDGVTGVATGARVVINAGKACGWCPMCAAGRGVEECYAVLTMGVDYDGAFAEFVVAPASACVLLPAGIPFDQGAILADAVATPFSAVVETAGVRPGESVAIFGIGGLGTHAVQIARLAGASFVAAVDPRPGARDRALAAGASIALDPDGAPAVIKDATGGVGVDAAFDFVGANAVLKAAVASLAPRGRAVIVGVGGERIQLGPSIRFAFTRTSLLGAYGYARRHLEALTHLLESNRLDLSGSITAKMPLDRAPEAIEALSEKQGDPVRIVLEP